MQFTKLCLSGFKSFTEPSELIIEAGITGIVGPNGCGKSNLVEALRWVMGESSAKRMRGTEMEDVIFGGTDARPAKQSAEVRLLIDNALRRAPANFNHLDELEISRKIVRGEGSDYRVNGKSVRARDIQLLFADIATGANSPAMVTQGRVGSLINTRPQERRALLEEAAGIVGLHSRRSEAELKLRATEENLKRVDDILVTLNAQAQTLRKQAKQAARYRGLGERIRKLEAAVLWLRWQAAQTAEEQAKAAHAAFDAAVNEAAEKLRQALAAKEECLGKLTQARNKDAEAKKSFGDLSQAIGNAKAETQRTIDTRALAEKHLLQFVSDIERENNLVRDAASAVEKIDAEVSAITSAQENEKQNQLAVSGELEKLRAELSGLDHELNGLTRTVAEAEANKSAMQKKLVELEERQRTVTQRRDEQTRLLNDIDSNRQPSLDLETVQAALKETEEALEKARLEAEAAEKKKQEAEAAVRQAADFTRTAEAECVKYKAEIAALEKVLSTEKVNGFSAIIDELSVEKGYEAAVAAAFGEALQASLDENAPAFWRNVEAGSRAVLPVGTQPLLQYVKAPPIMELALSQTAVVQDSSMVAELAKSLVPGQVLVTLDGGCWRWDGYTARAGVQAAEASHLEHKNRLVDLRYKLSGADKTFTDANETSSLARQNFELAGIADSAAREAVRQAFAKVGEFRNRAAKATQEVMAVASRRQALSENLLRIEEDLAAVKNSIDEANKTLAGISDTGAERARAESLRGLISEKRIAVAEKQSALDRLVHEAEARKLRQQTLAEEKGKWQTRLSGANSRVAELGKREALTKEEIHNLTAKLAAIEKERAELQSKLIEAEQVCRTAAVTLTEAEAAATNAANAEKAVEAVLAEARENRIRAEAGISAAQDALQNLRARIAEKIGCEPPALAEIAEITGEENPEQVTENEEKLARLLKERDNMGPVNLRAEIEMQEIEQQVTKLTTEKDEVVAAIAKLRQGISNLNREARERLLEAFDKVNEHFQALFQKLFGGGKAHISLVEADDPLESGLEIFASPPGKKLQVLSLLSGGEQALTALALLFAVFLTNPSPICVLDEVDAPLDEANVDRFCNLVEELARENVARFIVVTHHRMTMARADRLFGVTMTEKGVSRLVSVDLQEAERIRKTA